MQAFSREALELYIPVMQEEVRAAVQEWLAKDSCVLVYPEMKRLMFRIAMRLLLGFDVEQIKTDEQQLVEAFEEMIKNLFSLPIDVPFSGLYRVRGRGHLERRRQKKKTKREKKGPFLKVLGPTGSKGEELHPRQDRRKHQEEATRVRRRVQAQRRSPGAHRQQQKKRTRDEHAGKKTKTPLNNRIRKKKEPVEIAGCFFLAAQALKESATELLFGGHETTASTATSLIMFLGLNPEVLDKLRQELTDKVI